MIAVKKYKQPPEEPQFELKLSNISYQLALAEQSRHIAARKRHLEISPITGMYLNSDLSHEIDRMSYWFNYMTQLDSNLATIRYRMKTKPTKSELLQEIVKS